MKNVSKKKFKTILIILCIVFALQFSALVAAGSFIYASVAVTPLYKSSSYIIMTEEENYFDALAENKVKANDKKSSKYPKTDEFIEKLEDDSEIISICDESTLEIDALEDSPIIRIFVTDENPKVAADLANQVAEQSKKSYEKYYSLGSVETIWYAKTTTNPVSPNKTMYSVIGGIIGLIVGTGIAILAGYLINKKYKKVNSLNADSSKSTEE